MNGLFGHSFISVSIVYVIEECMLMLAISEHGVEEVLKAI